MHPPQICLSAFLALLATLTISDFPSIPNPKSKIPNGLVLAQTPDVLKAEASSWVDRAIAQAQADQLDAAIQSWQQALTIYQKIGDRQSQGGVLNSIGLAYRNLGQYPKALESLQQALDLLKAVGDRGAIGTTFSNMGLVYSSMGKYSQAVEYSLISNRTLFIWGIKPTGEVTFRQVDLKPPNNLLEELVSSSRVGMGVGSRGTLVVAPGTRAIQAQRLQELYQILIQPIADFLPKDATERVVFIPHRSLFLVPFAALQDTNNKRLIEKHTILTAPAIQVLDLTRQQRKQVSGTGALVVGNPTIAAQVKQEYSLEQLRGAEQEAIAIAQILNTKAIIGDQPTKAVITQQMPNARIIHLATHGLLDDVKKLPIPGAIVLAPSDNDNGLLTAGEIVDLKLNAELVVLSACDTGQGQLKAEV
jgi:CHAT domain-containing protein